MWSITKGFALFLITGIGLGLAASPAAAQATVSSFSVPSSGGTQITNVTNGSGQACPYRPGFGYNPLANASAAYGNVLSGVSDVYNAQGQFLIQRQESRLVQQQAIQAQLDTKHKALDEWLYERAVTPTLEDYRDEDRAHQLRRSRNDPPSTEIWSGKALNDLLLHIQRTQAPGQQGPFVALDPSLLPQINLTSEATTGGVGLLKDGGKLRWPLPLKSAAFDADRKRIDDQLPRAYQQAGGTSGVDADTLSTLQDALDKLYQELDDQVDSLTPTKFIQSKRFLNEVKAGLKTLEDPNVSNYVSRKWAARGNSVGELVQDMTRQGLKFAPAVSGEEAAYNALHNAVVSYDVTLSQLMGQALNPPPVIRPYAPPPKSLP